MAESIGTRRHVQVCHRRAEWRRPSEERGQHQEKADQSQGWHSLLTIGLRKDILISLTLLLKQLYAELF